MPSLSIARTDAQQWVLPLHGSAVGRKANPLNGSSGIKIRFQHVGNGQRISNTVAFRFGADKLPSQQFSFLIQSFAAHRTSRLTDLGCLAELKYLILFCLFARLYLCHQRGLIRQLIIC